MTTADKAVAIKLEDIIESDGLNYDKWVIDAINGDVARHKAKRLDKYARFIFDVEKLETITGLRRTKKEANKHLWSVWE
jgi:hypothetical protein